MKLTINRADLKKVLTNLKLDKNTLVLMKTYNKKLYLQISSNCNLNRICNIKNKFSGDIITELDCNVEENGFLCIKITSLLPLLKGKGDVSLIREGHNLLINGVKLSLNIINYDLEDKTHFYNNEENEINTKLWFTNSNKTLAKLTTTSSVYNKMLCLQGVYFDKKIDNTLTLVSTDGHRMTTINVEEFSCNNLVTNFILPRPACEIINKLNSTDFDIYFRTDTDVRIKIDNFLILTSILNLQYPKYENVAKPALANKLYLKCNTDTLVESLKLLSSVAKENTGHRKIKFEVKQKSTTKYLILRADNKNDNMILELDVCTNLSEGFKIALDYQYLLDILQYIKSKSVKLLVSSDNNNPILIRGDNKEKFVLMPMRI